MPGEERKNCQCKCCRRARKDLKREALCELATEPFEYRDEAPNNVEHPEWGQPGQNLTRAAPAQYADGISEPGGAGRPSAREISNVIFAQSEPHPNKRGASALFWVWGQFLDHDVGLTNHAVPSEPFPIAVPTGDIHFDPESTGTQTIPLERTKWDPTTGTDASNPREQVNEISAFIDGGNVYGSSARAAWLRYGEGGRLSSSVGHMMPYNDGTMDNAMGKTSAFYVGGDVRANENLGLLSLHTIFMREHNYWARELHRHEPTLSDNELYERARVMVEAEIQAITINEFLPLLLGGKEVFGKYQGYDASVNPQTRNEFTTAAYRLGHTLVSAPYLRLEECGEHIHAPELSLRDAFFKPFLLANDGGVEPVLRGLATVVAEEFDGKVIDDLRNFLFGEPEPGSNPRGLDLTALNIQRGRDHGLADYNTTREAYGLPKITSFSEVISDTDTVSKLESLYGTPDNADLYVVLQLEDHVRLESGVMSMLGPTTMAILGEQAVRMRSADRFWYQRRLPKHLLKYVENVRLSDIILRNTNIEWIQDQAMLVESRPPPPNKKERSRDHHKK